jgi:hypothetical protein
MKIKQQTVSPKQFEVIDDDDQVLGCHDTEDVAVVVMNEIVSKRSAKPLPEQASSVAQIVSATRQEIKQIKRDQREL